MKSLLTLLAACAIMCAWVGCETPQPKQPNRDRHEKRHVAPIPPKPTPKPIPKPVVKVLAFTASWCGPCQRSKPYLAEIAAKGVEVQIIDIDENQEMSQQYEVTSVPTFFVTAHGKTVRSQDINEVVTLTTE